MLKTTSLAMLICTGSLLAQSYFIKGPENPKPHERTAIKELNDYLARRIAGKLTIGGKSPITFQVGDTELAKASGLLSSELPEEKWHIKSIGDQVILNGGGTRGALYATYHFLEDYCGVHWWNDFEDYVPKASSLELESLDASGKPAFLYRDIYITPFCSPATSIRNRLNRCGDAVVNADLGGSFTYGQPTHAHTFDKYVPAAKYLDTHPEYFSLHDGKRVGGKTKGQLCLCNPELKSLFLENILKYIEADKAKAAKDGVPAPRIYDVSMNDNHNCCECPECTAEADKYGQSGHYLNFVNWIAREVGKKYPGIYISTLAYYFTEPPPKGGVRANDNVIVKLCDTQTTAAASILDPENKVFHDFVSQWKNSAKNLFVWDYAITYTRGSACLPLPSEFHYGDTYKYYHENNVTGIFWEHEEPDNTDFFELKFFIECKLYENPYQDVNVLIDTFMNCYYGAAAPYILKYRQKIAETRKAHKGFVPWFPSIDDYNFITADDIVECQQLFDAAETAVSGDKVLAARVRHARSGLDWLTCYRRPSIPYHGDNATKPDERLDSMAAAKRQLDAWPEWCMNFPRGKILAEAAKNSILLLVNPDLKPCPAPEEFKDRNFYDFHPYCMDNHDAQNIQIVKDDESQIGEAVRIDVAGDKYYDPPFDFGFYHRIPNETKPSVSIPEFPEPGYHWFTAGKTIIPPRGNMFLNRKWTYQLHACITGLVGKEFEIWAHIKATGPKYRPGDTGPDYIYIDRILFVEPKDK